MKIGVIGSRTFHDLFLMERILDFYYYNTHGYIEIISGGARGADKLVEKYVRNLKQEESEGQTNWKKKYSRIDVKVFKPDYDKYPGNVAPLKRNDEIVRESDFIIAFWNKKSRGTKYVIDKALREGKSVLIVPFADAKERK